MRTAGTLAAMALALFLGTGCGERESKPKADKALPAVLPGEAVDQAAEGNLDKVKAALGKTPALAQATDEEGKTLLFHAATRGKADVVELLLARGADPNVADEKGFTPLYRAALEGHKDAVRLLLEKGAGPNAKTKEGDAPLHAATDHLKGLPKHAGCVEVVRLLIAHKAAVNAKAKDDMTPLHLAAKNGHKDIAELLLAAKAEVDPRATLYQETPLHMAVVYDHQDVVELLLANKADINAKDKHDRTPLARARHMRHRELVELIREKGGSE